MSRFLALIFRSQWTVKSHIVLKFSLSTTLLLLLILLLSLSLLLIFFSLLQELCCGIDSYKDWFNSPFSKSENATNTKVPDSCCKTISDGCGTNFNIDKIHDEVQGTLIITMTTGVTARSIYCSSQSIVIVVILTLIVVVDLLSNSPKRSPHFHQAMNARKTCFNS